MEDDSKMTDDMSMGKSTQHLVDESPYASGRRRMQYVATFAVTLAALSNGTLLGWSSPASASIVSSEYGFHVTDDDQGWIGSLVTLGAAFSCMPIGYLMDRLGRKITMLLLVAPYSIGWGLIIWAQNIEMLYVGRFISGMAVGAATVVAPVYTGEIVEAKIRGALGSFFEFGGCSGMLFVYAIGSVTSVFVFSLVSAAIPLIFGVVFFFMPETPAFFVSKGHPENARRALIRLRGKNYNLDAELLGLQDENHALQQNAVPLRQAFTTPAAKKALVISIFLMIFQQFSGVNAVLFYTSDIFLMAGSSIPEHQATIIVGVMLTAATLVSISVVDRLGRRILLLISASFMAICCFSLGVFFYLKEKKLLSDGEIAALGWLPLTSLCIFIISCALGFGPIPFMVLGELFPSEIKETASSIAATVNWLSAFIVTKTFGMLTTGIGIGETFWMYGSISVLATIFVFFIVPETKGKTLQEIQILFGGEAATSKVNKD